MAQKCIIDQKLKHAYLFLNCNKCIYNKNIVINGSIVNHKNSSVNKINYKMKLLQN